ncbi:MAG: 50S ribosomal protein L25 [Candidatus Zixiibacteriota bacterium]|nr:MAG: 50S ribosomal protein L25 [candidate division Zixibacteria bacterium]
MDEISLNARLRHGRGKGVAHRLRASGYIPGVFYQGQDHSIPLEINAHELQLTLKKNPQLILLKLDDGTQHECVVRDLQREPISGRHLHIDLLGIARGQKVTTKVAVELEGIPQGVRLQGGVLQHSIHSLNIECLPRDIPAKVTVEVSELKVGSSVHISDVQVPNVRILDDPEITIATVLAPRVEKAAATPEEAAAEGEAAEGEATES